VDLLTQDWRISAAGGTVFALVIGWQLLHHEPSIDPRTTGVSVTTPGELASSKSPNQHLEQIVRWEGEVEKVDPANHTIRFRQQGQVISATLPGSLPEDIRQGSQVEVTGRIMGRGRLGSIYLLAHVIQPR
jgi:hypothetical protein